MKKTAALKVTTPHDREIVMTRDFDAPRGLVWDFMTQPPLLKRWLFGPSGWSLVDCEIDLKVGGVFRYLWHGPDEITMAMHGVFRELIRPERIVHTESFEFGCDAQAGEQVVTLVLTERGSGTTLRLSALYPSKEARDATIASGMEQGVAAGYDRLDGLLAVTPARTAGP